MSETHTQDGMNPSAQGDAAKHVPSHEVNGNPPADPEASREEERCESQKDSSGKPPDLPADSRAETVAPTYPPAIAGCRKGRRLVKKDKARMPSNLTAEQRLLILDTWRRSGLPAGDFSAMVGLSKHALWNWKKRFDEAGPAGLMDRPKGGPRGSRMSEITKRAIVMMKTQHPDWGVERISMMLERGPALPTSPSSVAKVLHEAGYEMEERLTRPHKPKVTRFERPRPNVMWQTDIFTFLLKRQNRRVYLVAFLDDYSRFVVGYGLHGSMTTPLVNDVLRSAVASYGCPEEVLSDNGPQYAAWRGKSAFTKDLERQGVRHILAAPKRPMTVGKAERFWGTLWRELVEKAVFMDLEDARRRIGLFIDWYNFHRPHQGIDKATPSERFFLAAPEVLKTLREQVAENAEQLARHGVPKEPFYLTGRVGNTAVSLHVKGEKLVLTRADGSQSEVDWVAPEVRPPLEGEDPGTDEGGNGTEKPELPQPVCPAGRAETSDATDPANAPVPLPGVSPLDAGLKKLAALTSQSAPAPVEAGPEGAQGEAPASGEAPKGEEGGDE